MTEIPVGTNAEKEADVRLTPRSYAIITEPDPDNPAYTRERLVMNFGAFGSTGFRYADIIGASGVQNRINMMQERADICAAAIAANPTATNSDTIVYYNTGDDTTYTYTLETFKRLERMYRESVDYYSIKDGSGNLIGPYIPTYELNVTTRVKTEQLETETVTQVKNSYSVEGAFSKPESSVSRDNFWSANISARVAENGEAQIFKADSLYGNTAGDKADAAAVPGFMGYVSFEVYAAGDTNAANPLTFNFSSSGKFVYDSSGIGTHNYIMTDIADGSAIMSGLPEGDYYLKEISAPNGYYTGQNPKIEFTVSSTSVTYKLANNDPRGVSLIKVDADDTGTTLEGAIFKLYSYTKDDFSDAVEVTGFTQTAINGADYLVYNGSGTDALTTGSNGKLEIVRLEAGKYYLEEVTAPSGYELSDEKYTFELKESKTGSAIYDLGLVENESESRPSQTSRTVTKAWDDNNDQDGKRPASIQVQLYADAVAEGSPIELNAANNWTYTWNNLPEKSGGNTIAYTVVETVVPSDYTASYSSDGFTITNTHTPETVGVSGIKTWDDNSDRDGKRPASITVNLLADGVKVDSKTVTVSDSWAYAWTGLAEYDNGTAIVYTVTEDMVADYNTVITGYNITNKYTPGETSRTVTKAWDDNNDRDGKRPTSIQVQLYADAVAEGSPIELNAANNWTYTWNNLPEKSGGNTIAYTVKEITEADGYTATYSEDTFIITNTLILPDAGTHKPDASGPDISATNTGDNSNMMLWLLLGGASLTVLGITVKRRKRNAVK